jgi:mRNA interferase RelE/StbE
MTTWTVEVAHLAEKKLARLPASERSRIFRALTSLSLDPFQHDVKQLKGSAYWRLRVGRWRVILRVDRDRFVIVAVDLGPRGDVYK